MPGADPAASSALSGGLLASMQQGQGCGDISMRLCHFLPSLEGNSPPLDLMAHNGLAKFMNNPLVIANLNATNPQGTLAKLLKALQLNLMGGKMFDLASKLPQEHEGAPISPSVPNMNAGSSSIEV